MQGLFLCHGCIKYFFINMYIDGCNPKTKSSIFIDLQYVSPLYYYKLVNPAIDLMLFQG
ncbi:hypothetical protein B0I26_1453 [Anoxybacillus vitaminiphilus]|uniref:Uncharacterized protein n=1 Tax=Paranoxybacillus vitaminiphilus TaxID=581036 RepID=A0A327XYT6_9BACL|nr:hypothetical protein B0I26_1453 [Anoxybacillus vitaminiphilus]